VLQVAFGEEPVGFVPVSCLQQVAHDVIDNLLVGVQKRVRAGEQRLLVGYGDNCFLCLD
jgi:hypothetical protein